MTLVVADRVKETTVTTGTGALALQGAVTGFQTFAAKMAVNDTCWYSLQAVDATGLPSGAWEVGIGTYSGTNTLTRTSILSSSNGGAAVNLAAGTKHVWIGVPAANFAQNKFFRPPTTALFSTIHEDAAGPGSVSYDADIGYCLSKAVGLSDSLAFRGKNVPSGTWTATARIKFGYRGSSFDRFGLFLSDGTKFQGVCVDTSNDPGLSTVVGVNKFANTTTWSGTDVTETIRVVPDEIWMRIQDNGTNWLFSYSMDGLVWKQLYSVARNTYLTATKIGLVSQNYSTGFVSGGVLNCVYYNDPDYPS